MLIFWLGLIVLFVYGVKAFIDDTETRRKSRTANAGASEDPRQSAGEVEKVTPLEPVEDAQVDERRNQEASVHARHRSAGPH